MTFYGVLWAAGGNDVIAHQFNISLNATTWFFRVAVLAGLALAFVLTRRICRGLRARDRETLEHGYETGIIQRTLDGGFVEVTRPLPEEQRAILASRRPIPRIAPPGVDARGVRAPGGAKEKARAVLNRLYADNDLDEEADGGAGVARRSEHEDVPPSR